MTHPWENPRSGRHSRRWIGYMLDNPDALAEYVARFDAWPEPGEDFHPMPLEPDSSDERDILSDRGVVRSRHQGCRVRAWDWENESDARCAPARRRNVANFHARERCGLPLFGEIDMSILNRTAVRDRLIAEYHKCYRGTINVKDRVTADTIARVEAAALREIELIAKANFGPGKTITARGS